MSNENNGVKSAGSGVATGAIESIAAVWSAGAVTGLGATGITSGLSAIGTVAGGSIATGLAITATAPLAVGALDYPFYYGG